MEKKEAEWMLNSEEIHKILNTYLSIGEVKYFGIHGKVQQWEEKHLIDMANSKVAKKLGHDWQIEKHSYGKLSYDTIWSQFYKIYYCFSKIIEHEINNQFAYDFVFQIRFDEFFGNNFVDKEKLEFLDNNPRTIAANYWYINELVSPVTKEIIVYPTPPQKGFFVSDIFSYGKRNIMKEYCDLILHVGEYDSEFMSALGNKWPHLESPELQLTCYICDKDIHILQCFGADIKKSDSPIIQEIQVRKSNKIKNLL